MTFRVTTQVTWHGDRVINKLVRGAGRGIVKAVELYFNELTGALKRAGEGSIPVSSRKLINKFGGNATRLRIKHSRPGQVPLIQTFNLLNSIKKSFNFGMTFKGSRKLTFKGRISSDVKYAVTLERGGNFSGRIKKHTSLKLVNPLKGRHNIAPRPVWTPVWQKTVNKMLAIIKIELTKSFSL